MAFCRFRQNKRSVINVLCVIEAKAEKKEVTGPDVHEYEIQVPRTFLKNQSL
jgi:hypothetical protein